MTGRSSLKASARVGILLVTLAGLAGAAWTLGANGFADVAAAAIRVGAGGFALFCAYSMGLFVLLGSAWLVAAPGEPAARIGAFAWARMLREAVSDLLPFSQIGGIVVGTRALTQAGIAPLRVFASLAVDLTTEMASQLVFALFGLAAMATLLAENHDAVMLYPQVLGGTAALAGVLAMFSVGQRPAVRFAERIARHILPGSATAMAGLSDALRAIYRNRSRVALAFLLNLAAWIASALGAWLVLALMSTRISVWAVLALESMIFTVRSMAFAIPGAIGVQEVSYAVIAPLFGLPAETALALSLIKRAREVAIGLPTLLIWQLSEARALVRAPGRVGDER